MDERDLIIIGAGSAGLTAGIFAARNGLNTLILESIMPGGQIINVEKINDYPGYPEGISGAELSALMQDQAMNMNADFVLSEVESIKKYEFGWQVITYDSEYAAKSLIIAAGSKLAKLGKPGENELTGSGVSYCATCDGAFFIDQKVCVVGGGDSAFQEALSLTKFAKEITIFCRNRTPHAQQILQDLVKKESRIKIQTNREILEIHGDGMVESITVNDTITNNIEKIKMTGVFVFVGLNPNSNKFTHLVETDTEGRIITNSSMKTSAKGIFAAGDIRHQSPSQILTSASDGAIAGNNAYKYINGVTW